MVTQEQINARKAEIRRMGMASFTISGMTEDESIASEIRKDASTLFAAVRSEMYKRNAKYPSYRVFRLDPERPAIPMGYSGSPSFTFESQEKDPRTTAIKLLRERADEQGLVVQTSKLGRDEFSYKAIKKEAA